MMLSCRCEGSHRRYPSATWHWPRTDRARAASIRTTIGPSLKPSPRTSTSTTVSKRGKASKSYLDRTQPLKICISSHTTSAQQLGMCHALPFVSQAGRRLAKATTFPALLSGLCDITHACIISSQLVISPRRREYLWGVTIYRQSLTESNTRPAWAKDGQTPYAGL